MRQKKCKICKTKFTPIRQLQPTCTDINCMVEYGNRHLAKKKKEKITIANKERKKFKENDKTELKIIAQRLVNKYARLRDEKERGLRCCTCSKRGRGKYDGGHFLPTSGYSSIRYNTNQIHLQCVNCNMFNGGRYKEYRVFMINKYNIEYVEALEATRNILRSYSVDYYKKLIRIVKKKIKNISKN